MNEKVLFILNPVGRICLCLIFLMSAVGNKIPNFTKVSEYMASEGVPMPTVMLAGAIVFLLVGCACVILGFKTRLGALLLLVFLALATYFFHDFWTFAPDAPAYQEQMIQFLKNLALMGAMLILIARGSGPLSMDKGKK